MKNLYFLVILLFSFCLSAQSNNEIATIYFNRATESFNENKIDKSFKSFNKAIDLIQQIEKPENASLGAFIYYELKMYEGAKEYIKMYFNLTEEKGTIAYQTMLELYVTIDDKIDLLAQKVQQEKEALVLKEKQEQKLRDLKSAWNGVAEEYIIKVDTIFSFNKNNSALFKKEGNFGLINDKGVVLVKEDSYVEAYGFDGFYLLTNDSLEPTKIMCFDTENEHSFVLPSISKLSPTSTHYEKIMYPRGNGILVLYPNNSKTALFYDLKLEEILNIEDQKDFFKELKNSEVIEKFKKEGEVEVDDEWYLFGGSFIGGGVYPLYLPNNSIHGYLFSSGKNNVVLQNEFNYVGSYYNKRLQVINGNTIFWIDANGNKAEAPENENGLYGGASEIVKIKDNNYFIQKNTNGVKTIIKGDKEIMTLNNYLKKNN